MYFATFCQIMHYGPRADKGLRSMRRTPSEHGAQIYLDALSGDVKRAVTKAMALQLDLDVITPTIAECAVLDAADDEPTALLEALYDLYPGFATAKTLQSAVEINSADMVKFLLAKGINPSSCPTILSRALEKPRYQIETNSPIQLCSSRRYRRPDDNIRKYQIISLLLDTKADPNEKSPEGSPVLMTCMDQYRRTRDDYIPAGSKLASMRHIEMLLRHGADVNARDGRGRTALDCADGDCKIVKILEEHGGKKGCDLV